MPLATAITSRTGGRSLAMALRTQNFVGHFLLPPVSPHEDMGRGRNIHNSLDEPSRIGGLQGDRLLRANIRFGPKRTLVFSGRPNGLRRTLG